MRWTGDCIRIDTAQSKTHKTGEKEKDFGHYVCKSMDALDMPIFKFSCIHFFVKDFGMRKVGLFAFSQEILRRIITVNH